jgi:hypothetical protein
MKLERDQTFPGGFDRSEVPAEYVPSFATVLSQCPQDTPPGMRQDPSDPQSEEVIELPNERSRIFNVFIHWLYTGQLPSNVRGFSMANLVEVYALAERLQVPLLRRQCYRKIYEFYQTNDSVPEPAEARIVMDSCLETSLLRKFYVSKAAYAVIKNGKEQEEAINNLLDPHPDFAREVSGEIMSRLRADDVGFNPIMDSDYESDDSDSDFESSEDGDQDDDDDTLPSEPDSVDWFSPSEDGDHESLVGESEGTHNSHAQPSTDEQIPEHPKTEEPDTDTNRDASLHQLLPNPASPPESYAGSAEDEGSEDERGSNSAQDSKKAKCIAGSNQKHPSRTKTRDAQNSLSEPVLANDSQAWSLQDLPPSALNLKPRTEVTLSTSAATKVSPQTARTNMQASSSTAPTASHIGVKRQRADGMDDDRGQTPPSKIHVIDLST